MSHDQADEEIDGPRSNKQISHRECTRCPLLVKIQTLNMQRTYNNLNNISTTLQHHKCMSTVIQQLKNVFPALPFVIFIYI